MPSAHLQKGTMVDTQARCDQRDKDHVERTSFEFLDPGDLKASLPPPPIPDPQTNQLFKLVQVRFLPLVIEDIQLQHFYT